MRRPPNLPPRIRYHESGFTLVELMVSATILGLATIGAFAMIGVGRSLDTDETLRRQAYQYATAELEKPAYSVAYTAFDAIQSSPTPAQTVPLTRVGALALNAHISVTVVPANANLRNILPDDPTNPNPNPATQAIPYKEITAKVKWTASTDDSVVVIKWVTAAQ